MAAALPAEQIAEAVRLLAANAVQQAEGRERSVEEAQIRSQTARIDKCTGEDGPKLRRWIRDVDMAHAATPNIARRVAVRTSQGPLADTMEEFFLQKGVGQNHSTRARVGS